MQRRKFLLNSGIIASAIVVTPSSVWAGDKRTKTGILIIHEAGADRHFIHSVIKNSSDNLVQELSLEKINELSYTSNGFLLKMNDSKQYLAKKIIFSSCKKIDVSGSYVKIKNGNKHIQLRHDTGSNKDASSPEFWAFSSARNFDEGKIMPFIKRDKNAFMCIS